MSHLLQGETVHVHEVQTLRQELAETRKKLQEYADTVISLHGELRTLRDSICTSCKQKFVPMNLVSLQTTPNPSSIVKSSQGPAHPMFSWRRLLKPRASGLFPSSSGPPTPEIPTQNISQTSLSISPPESFPVLSTPTALSNVTTQKPIPSKERWSIQQNPTANAALDVTFICEYVQKNPVRSVRFSPDGKYLAAVVTATDDKNGAVFIYNVETGDKTCDLVEYASQYPLTETPASGLNCTCFSPNGNYLTVGDEAGRVTVWDIPKRRIRNMFRGHEFRRVQSVEFSPNGRYVVSGSGDGTVRMWNMRDGSARVFINNTLTFWSVRFSPSGRLVAAGNTDGDLRIWDVRTGRMLSKWTGHEDIVWDVAFMKDGNGLVSGGKDGVVKCWDTRSLGIIQSGGEPVATKILKCEGQSNNITALAVSPNSQWIASCFFNRKTVTIWDAHSVIPQCTLIGHTEVVHSVDFSHVGSYLALGSKDCYVTLWKYTGT